MRTLCLALGLLVYLAPEAAQAQSPPFGGTIFIDPDIVVESDPTVYASATASGRGMRTVYDRRVSDWVTVNAYLVEIAFTDGTTMEAQVNPEFGSEAAAMEQAEMYGPFVGQLPAALRRDIDALWIHQGTELFGGGNRSILIHTGQTALYLADGILEETLIHEAAHTSLDADHAASGGWLDAQNADPTFISTYARDNPTREDIAESFLPYMAIRYRADRISQSLYDTIVGTIPNRIAYFDAQGFDMSPAAGGSVTTEPGTLDLGLRLDVTPNPTAGSASIRLGLDAPQAVRVDIVDLLGRTVAEVASGPFASGETVVTFDARGLPGGTYVVRVVAEGHSISRPLVVQE